MKIYSVFDPGFKPYGQVVTGMEDTVKELLSVLKDAPKAPAWTMFPRTRPCRSLPACVEISEHCDSEFNLGTEQVAAGPSRIRRSQTR